jgi:hypothetical protein
MPAAMPGRRRKPQDAPPDPLQGAEELVSRRDRVWLVRKLLATGQWRPEVMATRLAELWHVEPETVGSYRAEAARALVAERQTDELREEALGRARALYDLALTDGQPSRAVRAALDALEFANALAGVGPAPVTQTSGGLRPGPGLRLVDRHGRDLSPKRADDTEGEGSAAAGDRGGEVLLGGTAKTQSSYL